MFLNKTQLRLCELFFFFFLITVKIDWQLYFIIVGINIVIYTSLFVITY